MVPGWDLGTTFMLDQIRRQEKSISYEAFGAQSLQRGSSFNFDNKTLVVWSFAPETNKSLLMYVKDIAQDSSIIWTLDSTTRSEISSALKIFSFMNETKVGQIEDQISQTFREYIDTRKLTKGEGVRG